jgi:DNA-binding winged helix-turn-helix (wHTH) protein
MVVQARKRLIRFGIFELDLLSGELRKQGIKIQLQPKPLQMLEMLLERPGEVVTRQDLRQRLWGNETFVDFESGLNTAANRLRLKLGDSAENPRYIETLARTGYRFIAPVEKVDWDSTPPAPQPEESPKITRTLTALLAILAIPAILALLLAAYLLFRPAPPRSVHFRQLTFRSGQITGARFTPDGSGILYGAHWDREPRQLFLTSAASPESRPLGFEDMSLASVSARGELALLAGGGTMNIGGGRLYRVPMNGGSPLLVDQSIWTAEWSRDGRAIALVRAIHGASQLEFPAGKVLYRTSGWLSSVRFSPAGDEIAFVEHPLRHDDRGGLKLLSLAGTVKTLSDDWESITGAAWDPRRAEIWFSAARQGAPRSIWAVTRSARLRPVAQAPGALTLRDIAPDGRALITRETRLLEMVGRLPSEAAECNYSWLDWSRVQELSADNRLILFDESGEAAGSHSLAYIRNTVDRTTVRLGEGVAMALDPDGKIALLAGEDRRRLRLTPVTGGPSRDLPDTGLKYQWLKFFPDGRRLLALAGEKQKGLRLYVQRLDSSSVVPISPEMMVRNAAISRDGARVAVLAPDNRLLLFRTAGGAPDEVATSEPLAPLRWSANDEWIYVQHLRGYSELPARVSRLRVRDGMLQPWREITPADRMGVTSVTGIVIGDDEQSYVYSFRRILSELYAANGW